MTTIWFIFFFILGYTASCTVHFDAAVLHDFIRMCPLTRLCINWEYGLLLLFLCVIGWCTAVLATEMMHQYSCDGVQMVSPWGPDAGCTADGGTALPHRSAAWTQWRPAPSDGNVRLQCGRTARRPPHWSGKDRQAEKNNNCKQINHLCSCLFCSHFLWQFSFYENKQVHHWHNTLVI